MAICSTREAPVLLEITPNSIENLIRPLKDECIAVIFEKMKENSIEDNWQEDYVRNLHTTVQALKRIVDLETVPEPEQSTVEKATEKLCQKLSKIALDSPKMQRRML
jgi:hypothetical protein